MRAGLAFILTVVASTSAPAQEPPEAQAVEFFEKKVRPILVERCHTCHSAQAKKLKGGLRLDSRESALRGGDTGPAIVPGKPEKSPLVEAVTYTNVDLRMPPKGKLADAEIAALAEWVRRGAPWPAEAAAGKEPAREAFDLARRKSEHWSWRPLRAPEPPPVRDSAWVKRPLDAFVLARLEEKGLAPAPPADRRTLIRRLTYDLVGLPPTAREVEDFVADPSGEALANAAGRLLSSPHFGEKWARHWLDLVRYAETRGHEYDYPVANPWPYRDAVIRALNADVPYAQFVTDHVAGDLLPEPRRSEGGVNESLLATGWWYLGEWLHSPVDLRADEMDRVANQIEVFGKTFLGLTVSCARCHDHKFDAISQRDYYALVGFLKSSCYRQSRFDAGERDRAAARELERLREAYEPPLREAFEKARRSVVERLDFLLEGKGEGPLAAAWAAHLRAAARDPRDPFHALATGKGGVEPKKVVGEEGELVVDFGSARELLQDGYAFRLMRPGEFIPGDAPSRPIARVVDLAGAYFDPAWAALKLAPGTDADPGKLNWMQAGKTLRVAPFVLKRPTLSFLVRGAGAALAEVDNHRMINGPLHAATTVTWKDEGLRWVSQNLKDYGSPDPSKPIHRIRLEFTPQSADFGVIRVVQGDAPPELPDTTLPPFDTAEAVRKAFSAPSPRLADWMARHPQLFDPLGDVGREYVEKRASVIARIAAPARTALAISEAGACDEVLLIRGNPATPGQTVPRRFLEAFVGAEAPSYGSASGRLDLARRMVDPAITPLVPRVMVNRVWHHLFGRGIVPTVDDFGRMGQPPTHPELLDFLASRFVFEGGSIKNLIRSIVLSNAYGMSGAADPRAREVDPANLLWHHRPARRLQAEAIRDGMLAVSGRLDPTLYGPPVPIHLDGFQDGRGKPKDGPLDGAGRRSIYLSVRRNFLPSMLLAFDFPQPFTALGRRSVSNVPAQALILRNNPFVHDQAAVWARSVLAGPGSAEDRIRGMFLSAYARPALEGEVADAAAFLGDAATLLSKERDDPAVWQALAHALFQAKEFILVP